MKRRILIVDDSPVLRAMVRDLLDPAAYEVAGEAGSGNEGLEAYNELKPDMVLLDLSMPDMDGIDCLKELLRLDPAACVLVMTANTQKATKRRVLALGAGGVLHKPFDPQGLGTALDRISHSGAA